MNKKEKRGIVEKKRKKIWQKRKEILKKFKNREIVIKKKHILKTPYGPVEIQEGEISGNKEAIAWVKDKYERYEDNKKDK